MTKKELLDKTNYSLRMKDLREFVEANKDLDDNAPCLVERVEDLYFSSRELSNGEKTNGWGVLLKEGYHYHRALSWNKDMYREEEKRKNGEEPEYGIENPLDQILGEKELEAMKEQFYQPHCITTDKEIVYIYSHY